MRSSSSSHSRYISKTSVAPTRKAKGIATTTSWFIALILIALFIVVFFYVWNENSVAGKFAPVILTGKSSLLQRLKPNAHTKADTISSQIAGSTDAITNVVTNGQKHTTKSDMNEQIQNEFTEDKKQVHYEHHLKKQKKQQSHGKHSRIPASPTEIGLDEEESQPKKHHPVNNHEHQKSRNAGNNKQKSSKNMRGKQKGNNKKPKKQRKPRDPYNFVFEYESDWGFHDEFKHIKIMPGNKIPIKRDRRIVFPNMTFLSPHRLTDEELRTALKEQHAMTTHSGLSSLTTGSTTSSLSSTHALKHIFGKPPLELQYANHILKQHPYYKLLQQERRSGGATTESRTIAEVMRIMKSSPYCEQSPIYLTMATVHDDLYVQLIQNFIYSMVKFNTSECSLVICVSDPRCMAMCDESFFPCYDYREKMRPLPSVMEQIAMVKLMHVPQALTMGVDTFMLDLDVGFLKSPKYLVQAFQATPIVDIMVQEDYLFIMNRSKAGWKQWHTEPLPNIGLFLCRANNKTQKMFDLAWSRYQKLTDVYEKSQPGRDQNIVLDAMRVGRGTFAMKYAYFSNLTTPLMDKLVLFHGHHMDLGGMSVGSLLRDVQTVAMHTTCYEKSTKVMGLKAASAFWSPRYYDALRPTITKQLIYRGEMQLLDEVRSLAWLAMSTGRSLIVPNILGSDRIDSIDKYQNFVLWPGFRVVYLKRSSGHNELKVEILEPQFYWRVARDYEDVPPPTVVYFNAAPMTGIHASTTGVASRHIKAKGGGDSLVEIRDKLLKLNPATTPRVILHPNPTLQLPIVKKMVTDMHAGSNAFTAPNSGVLDQADFIPMVRTDKDDPTMLSLDKEEKRFRRALWNENTVNISTPTTHGGYLGGINRGCMNRRAVKYDVNDVESAYEGGDIDVIKNSKEEPRAPLGNYMRSSRRMEAIGSTSDENERILQRVRTVLREELARWSDDSVGWFPRPYNLLRRQYGALPSLKDVSRNEPQVKQVLDGMRTCNGIFAPQKGNRTCFQICE